MKRLKSFIFSNSNMLTLASFIYNLNNIFRVNCSPHNKIQYSKAFLRKTRIKINKDNNSILIMTGSFLYNCSIAIYGKNNKVIIGKECRLKDVQFHIEDDNNFIFIGNYTTIAGHTHLACIEGTKITIGEDCMFSKDIVFRTGDSHSIIDENRNRINPSKDILIGNHVWIGNKVIVTKGVNINDNSIIGTGSLVTNSFNDSNIVIAGVPARKIKSGINWLRARI